MSIRTRETRINYKSVCELLLLNPDHGKAQFRCIRLFARKGPYSIVTYGDYLDWIEWFHKHTPQQRKSAYKEWGKKIQISTVIVE